MLFIGAATTNPLPASSYWGEMDLFIMESELELIPAGSVSIGTNISIQALAHLKDGLLEIQWTKKGISLDLGGAQGYDDYHAISPRILREGGLYKMWYSGSDGIHYRILYATSADGINWTKHGIVLDIGSPGEPDDTHVAYQWVLREGSIYKMWYSGLDDYTPYGGVYRIFYATSSDGINWTKHGVVLDADPPGGPGYPLTNMPCILREGSLYRMWYAGRDQMDIGRILYATSSDGINWTKHGVVLDAGPPGGLEEMGVSTPFVAYVGGLYRMWYAGERQSETRIFEATSPDGLNWKREGLVLDLGPQGSDDDFRLNEPFLEFSGELPQQMWYAARGTGYRILRATASPQPALITTSVSFYVDGMTPSDEIGRVDNLTIPKNGSALASISWEAQPLGNHTICARVDPDNLYSESNEVNNTACRETKVVPGGPEAEAGLDQVVDEGDLVKFNGTGSRENSLGRHSSDFDEDASKRHEIAGSKTSYEAMAKTNVSFPGNDAVSANPRLFPEDGLLDSARVWEPVGDKTSNPNVSHYFRSGLSYFWDMNDMVDSDNDGNNTNDTDATGPEPTWIYGDNGNFTVTLKVVDGFGNWDIDTLNITVLNVAPTILNASYDISDVRASILFRIAGEKWHNVEIYLLENDTEIGYANITRYPGSPNDQMVPLAHISINFSRSYSAIAYYTPEDDPVNGQMWGATPAWLILGFDNEEKRLHHTFNVRHEDTWIWEIEDLNQYFPLPMITVEATAYDPGSDDLTFVWNWGDGTTSEHIYYNDGTRPDPYPSPDINPMAVTDLARHTYVLAGTYSIHLAVIDDDGGMVEHLIVISIGKKCFVGIASIKPRCDLILWLPGT